MAAARKSDDELLVRAALIARQNAYAPYSGYAVGAALRGRDGRIIAGCNVENASYALSLCAERVAIGRAMAEGVREFSAIAVVTRGPHPGSPCGLCRQVLAEFSPRLRVIMATPDGVRRVRTMGALLPWRFTQRALKRPAHHPKRRGAAGTRPAGKRARG